MDRSPQVTSGLLFKLAPWDAIDSEFEKKIPFDAPLLCEQYLRKLVESGEARLYHLIEHGKRVGLIVCQVDDGAVKELVMVAAYCSGSQPFSRALIAKSEDIARELNCRTIRFHTVRPALARIAADEFGYRLTEVIMRKNVQE